MDWKPARVAYRFARHAIYVAATVPRLMGVHPRTCNLCGHRGHFLAFGQPPRFDAHCPSCGSLERHRLLKLWIDENADRIGRSALLHFAPEAGIGKILSETASSYESGDLAKGRARRILDIENIDLEPESRDIVVCSHVLEHVDDRKALREINRILRPGGIALLMTPVVEGWRETHEDEMAQTSSRARSLHFGQADHIRFYGSDIRLRLADAGFLVEEFTAREPDVSHYGLVRGDKVFVCTKQHAVDSVVQIGAKMSRKAGFAAGEPRREGRSLAAGTAARHLRFR